jgi:hypothetical protein
LVLLEFLQPENGLRVAVAEASVKVVTVVVVPQMAVLVL